MYSNTVCVGVSPHRTESKGWSGRRFIIRNINKLDFRGATRLAPKKALAGRRHHYCRRLVVLFNDGTPGE